MVGPPGYGNITQNRHSITEPIPSETVRSSLSSETLKVGPSLCREKVVSGVQNIYQPCSVNDSMAGDRFPIYLDGHSHSRGYHSHLYSMAEISDTGGFKYSPSGENTRASVSDLFSPDYEYNNKFFSENKTVCGKDVKKFESVLPTPLEAPPGFEGYAPCFRLSATSSPVHRVSTLPLSTWIDVSELNGDMNYV